MPQNPETVREAFYDDFFRRANQFAIDSLTLCPELESIAIIPSWEIRQEHLQAGVLTGRSGNLQSPKEVYHMAEQLHTVLNFVMKESFGILKFYDDRLGQMSEEIRAKQQQLAELNAKLEAESQRGTAREASPDATESSAD
jgi:hypothetical protein